MNATAHNIAAPAIDLNASEITAVVVQSRTFDGEFVRADLAGDIIAVGELDGAELAAGVCYRFLGKWDAHPRYGTQFKFDSYIPAERQEMMGTLAYLTRSNLGITKADAMRLWKALGSETITRLRDHPDAIIAERLLTDTKASHASALLASRVENEATKIALFELFATRGFPKSSINACIAKWGDRAPVVIRRDPFKMLVADIPGVGFKRADKLYCDLGHNPLRLKRQMLAGWHWMRTNGSGNTWEIEGGIMKAVLQAAGTFAGAEFVRSIELGLRAKWLAKRTGADGVAYYAERDNAESERRLATHIRRIMTHAAVWPTLTAGESIATDHQLQKLATFSDSAIGIISGFPGTGKTTLAACLIRKLLTTMPAGRIAVCAPTGKAAVRITEAMRRYELHFQATTIHRLLGVGGMSNGKFSFQHDESHPLEERVIVIDEMSMTDTDLAAAVFAAVPPGGNVLLLGDIGQLLPVGHGAPLRDMIAGGVPCGMLTEIKRNSGQIVLSCRDIATGKPFTPSGRVCEAEGMNLVHYPAEGEDAQQSGVVALLGSLRGKGFDPIWDVQVLVATNDKSAVSRKRLNPVLQDVLNPQDDTIPTDERNPKFRPGDKVICLKNTEIGEVARIDNADAMNVKSYRGTARDVYIANGDMGRVEAVNGTSAIVRFLLPDRLVKVVTKRRVKAETENGDGGASVEESIDFDLAYAITVHKSQGSEWPVTIVIIDEGAGPIGCREWLYTAISRAGRLCFLVGRMSVALRQSAKVSLGKRKTFLREQIEQHRIEQSKPTSTEGA